MYHLRALPDATGFDWGWQVTIRYGVVQSSGPCWMVIYEFSTSCRWIALPGVTVWRSFRDSLELYWDNMPGLISIAYASASKSIQWRTFNEKNEPHPKQKKIACKLFGNRQCESFANLSLCLLVALFANHGHIKSCRATEPSVWCP